MKYRIELLKPERTIDRMGAEDTVYIKTGIIHAERVKATGNRSEEVSEHFPDYCVEFNIRDAHTVEENWRIRQIGGYLYTVSVIIPNVDRGYKTLVCDRVNE